MLASPVTFTNSAKVHAPPIAETVLAMILFFGRGLDFAVEGKRRGEWWQDPFYAADTPMRELAGSTVGIVGYGGIGREVARLDAARAERDALEKNRNGDYEGARKAMEACLIRIREYAGEDDELQKLMAALRSKALRYGRSMDKISSKHLYATSSLALRGRLIPKGNAVRGSGGSTPSGVVH